jgi:thiol-disulfide isomerase/thioredoxin
MKKNTFTSVLLRASLAMAAFSGALLLILPSPSVYAAEGDFAPDFALPNLLTKEMFSLSDHKGKVILVDFWASWCGPCRASFPAYDQLRKEIHDQFGKDSFEVFAINVDMEKNEAFDFLKRQAVSFPILDENTGGETQHKYQILAMPTSFLIGPNGVIHVQHSGFNSAYVALIKNEVTKLVSRKRTKQP